MTLNRPEYREIPNLLRKYRRINGYSQGDVAKILGFKSSAILSRWESGRELPNIIDIVRLSVLYRTLIDAFFIDHIGKAREEISKGEQNFRNNEN